MALIQSKEENVVQVQNDTDDHMAKLLKLNSLLFLLSFYHLKSKNTNSLKYHDQNQLWKMGI